MSREEFVESLYKARLRAYDCGEFAALAAIERILQAHESHRRTA